MAVSVLVIDDHPLVRAGVRASLEPHPEVKVVGEAADVESAIQAVRDLRPDVALLDIHLPGGSGGGGPEVAKRCSDSGGTYFLSLSVSDSPQDVVAAIRAGARGYVTKSVSAQALVAAIRQVAAGDAAFSPRLAGFVLDAFGTEAAPEETDELDLLTAREQQVMRLIARGYTYKEVAGELYLSVKTIETHVSNVLRKLQLSNRAELARWAAKRNIV